MFENSQFAKRVTELSPAVCKLVNYKGLLIVCIFILQFKSFNCESLPYISPYFNDQTGPTVNATTTVSEVNDTTLSLKFPFHDLLLSVGEERNLSYTIKSEETEFVNLCFNSTDNNILYNFPFNLSVLLTNYSQEDHLNIKSKRNGFTLLTVKTSLPKNMTDLRDGFVRLSVHYSPVLDYVSDVVGWAYFLAWSISFYPQIILNWRRKSVIGLHFDFLALNSVGFLLYSAFNIGMYFISGIEREYFQRHPYGVNPVQLNDVIFSVHAFFACLIQVVQCIIYERGDQRISRTGRTLIGSITILSIVSLILGIASVIPWLDFLYFLSYIKLFITLIKYIPQAYYNYLRKSTSGWSIGNILLDFTGGTLSICQMFIISFNYNDWGSIFGDPTKFGLGFFSILFDIFFIIQHYVLYKDQESYIPFPDSPALSRSSSSNSHSPLNYGTIE